MTDFSRSDDRSLAARLIDGVKGCFERSGEEQEWRDLAGSDRQRIAHDLGMSGSDLGAVIANGGGAAELDELLARTGLQQAAAMRGALPDLQRTCSLCHQREECRDWLSVPAEARDETALPYFCPNRQELEVLREMHGGSVGR